MRMEPTESKWTDDAVARLWADLEALRKAQRMARRVNSAIALAFVATLVALAVGTQLHFNASVAAFAALLVLRAGVCVWRVLWLRV